MCLLAFAVYSTYVFIHPSDTVFGIYTAAVVALFGWFAKVSVDEKARAVGNKEPPVVS